MKITNYAVFLRLGNDFLLKQVEPFSLLVLFLFIFMSSFY